MTRLKNPDLLQLQDWLLQADDVGIRSRMQNDAYAMAYPALVSHFASLKDLNWELAVVGLHVVYGWMPTIPKLESIMTWPEASRQKLTDLLIKAKRGCELDDDEVLLLRAFANNSMIGASKLLHFINPTTFPIWDSRVAKAFLLRSELHEYQVNAVLPWQQYSRTLAEWSDQDCVKSKCRELRMLAPFLEKVSDLRLLELVLFHQTISRRRRSVSDT